MKNSAVSQHKTRARCSGLRSASGGSTSKASHSAALRKRGLGPVNGGVSRHQNGSEGGVSMLNVLRIASIACLFFLPFQPIAADSPQKGFQEFWQEFRAAVISDDVAKVASLTHFPFQTRGTLDEAPMLQHDRNWFMKMFPKMLQADPGLRMEPDTTRALIIRTDQITEKHANGKDSWRVGDLVFKRLKGQWLFTMAYWEETLE
jgi:hypothetical protein